MQERRYCCERPPSVAEGRVAACAKHVAWEQDLGLPRRQRSRPRRTKSRSIQTSTGIWKQPSY